MHSLLQTSWKEHVRRQHYTCIFTTKYSWWMTEQGEPTRQLWAWSVEGIWKLNKKQNSQLLGVKCSARRGCKSHSKSHSTTEVSCWRGPCQDSKLQLSPPHALTLSTPCWGVLSVPDLQPVQMGIAPKIKNQSDIQTRSIHFRVFVFSSLYR